MTANAPGPNDPVPYEERAKKTIRNMENAEAAMEFAEGKELAAIKAKNARREKSLGWNTTQDHGNNNLK